MGSRFLVAYEGLDIGPTTQRLVQRRLQIEPGFEPGIHGLAIMVKIILFCRRKRRSTLTPTNEEVGEETAADDMAFASNSPLSLVPIVGDGKGGEGLV